VEIPDWLYQEDSAPRSLTVTDNTEKVGVLLGFGKYFGDWRVAYELAEINGGSDFKPMMVGGSHNLEISYTF
jgi:hypothetical protein